MRTFSIKLCIFLVIFKICDIILAASLSALLHMNDRSEVAYGSLNILYSDVIDPDVVIFGSSRTFLHINPVVLEELTGHTAWNFGMDGSNFDQHLFELEEYLLHHKVPQLVIFEAETLSLSPLKLRFKKEEFQAYLGASSHSLQGLTRDWQQALAFRLVASAHYKVHIPDIVSNAALAIKNSATDRRIMPPSITMPWIKEYPTHLIINGAHLKKGQVKRDLPSTLSTGTPMSFDLGGAESRKAGYARLARMAKQSGFTLILISSPWLDGSMDADQSKATSTFFGSIAAANDNIHYLDYTDHDTLSHSLQWWWNSGHLNIEGANLLSESIAGDIRHLLPHARSPEGTPITLDPH